jgi:phosphoribosylanthranilate isomerase
MRVKICGITNLEDALLCQKLGADALGFVFHRKSPRYIRAAEAAEITGKLSVFLTRVGVFVNTNPDIIDEISEQAGLTAVQLHGEESPEMVEKINKPVIKSFRVKPGFDFSQLARYKKQTILLDAYSDHIYGGTGSVFDWQLIPDQLRAQIILAGGISTDNIERIYNEINPAAVDLSSSLESSVGKKDAEKVKLFFSKIHHLKQRL